MSNPEIRFIKNSDIDYQKWDQCIASSSVPLIYAQSWYLDIVNPNWDALVSDDYKYVMPLCIQRKMGMSFLLQPIFAQQHGIFPATDVNTQNVFLANIYNRFKYIAIHINAGHSEPFPQGFTVQVRENYILDLELPYAEIKKNYSKHTRRQIRKAEDNKVFILKGLQSSEYFDLKKAATPGKLPVAATKTLNHLIEYGHNHSNGVIYCAYNQFNTLCAAAFFLFSENRVTYLNAVSTKEGKNINAMHLIVDQFIKEHSGTALTLDFEGSMIPGIARFYKGFGAQTEKYYSLKSNRLPLPIRWLIKLRHLINPKLVK